MTSPYRTAVVGVGGAGVNAVSRLMDVGLADVQYVAADTSHQTLVRADGAATVLLSEPTRGLGTGGDQRLGAAAAVAAERTLLRELRDVDVAFVVAGLAGGTGGGASAEVARIARRAGALTLGFGIRPFSFEAPIRQRMAALAEENLAAQSDVYVALDNERARAVAGSRLSLDVALRVADDVLRQAVQGLSELVSDYGYIDVDLVTVRRLLAESGRACLALGVGRGTDPACAAMSAALGSPLAKMEDIGVARSVLVQITGDQELAVGDVAQAVTDLASRLAPDCELVVGVATDPLLVGAVQVTVLGAGVGREPVAAGEAATPQAEERETARAPIAAPARVTDTAHGAQERVGTPEALVQEDVGPDGLDGDVLDGEDKARVAEQPGGERRNGKARRLRAVGVLQKLNLLDRVGQAV